MRLRRRGSSITLLSVLLLAGAAAAPETALGQDQAGITGQVVDDTEAALPGVTVEARSPALIEQVRTVFTDSAGNYRFITLPPGTYSVTFTLPGFRRVVREGVVLTGAFVAPVDARLEVGGLEETVMVTGVAPLVDVVSNRQQTVLTTEEINALPGSANVLTAMQYVPGCRETGTASRWARSSTARTVRTASRTSTASRAACSSAPATRSWAASAC